MLIYFIASLLFINAFEVIGLLISFSEFFASVIKSLDFDNPLFILIFEFNFINFLFKPEI
jgi:hypothetical protein